MKHPNLSGQVAVVSGASSGIGQACAIALAKAGCSVVINYYSDKEGGEKTLSTIEAAGGKGFIFQADVGNEAEVTAMFEKAIETYGAIDILISNAGIQKDAPLLEMSVADWEKVIKTNLTGHFICARQAARTFVAQGDAAHSRATGKIIFMSSVHDIIPWKGHINYTAAKGGLKMLMETMAQELGPKRIRVNAISPGFIKTDINKDAWSDDAKVKDALTKIPYCRLGEPEDVANAVVWLSSDQADYITGTTLYIDGGMTLYPSFQEGG